MSKYIGYDTEYTDLNCLFESLVEMGYPKNQMLLNDKTKSHLYGYSGDVRAEKANLVIPRHLVGHAANDVGFEMVNGKIVAHISDFDKGTNFSPLKQNKLKALYKKNALLGVLKKKNKKYKVTKIGNKIKVEI